MTANAEAISLFDGRILGRAARDAALKLNPASLIRNPVIFVTEIVAMLVTVLGLRALAAGQPWHFSVAIAAWLWLTVLFATFAEAVAEGRGRARREPAPRPQRHAGQAASAARRPGPVRSDTRVAPPGGRAGAGRGRRPDPKRR